MTSVPRVTCKVAYSIGCIISIFLYLLRFFHLHDSSERLCNNAMSGILPYRGSDIAGGARGGGGGGRGTSKTRFQGFHNVSRLNPAVTK